MFVRNTSFTIRKRIFKDSGIFLHTRFFIVATRLDSDRTEIARNVQDLLDLRFVKASDPARAYFTNKSPIIRTKTLFLHCQQCIGLGDGRILNIPQGNCAVAPRIVLALATENKEQWRLGINIENRAHRFHPVLTRSTSNFLNQILVCYNISMK